MNKELTPRYIVIGVILAWALYALIPSWKYQNLNENEKESLRESGQLAQLESKIIRQGLDLKGGMYIVLEADIPLLMSNLAKNKDERFEKVVKNVQEKLKAPDAEFFPLFKQEIASTGLKLPRYYHEFGGTIDDIFVQLEQEADDAINRVLEILQNRVDQFGVSEPTIQKQGKHRIVVELAGIQDPERARALLQSTALLEFYLVKGPEISNDIIQRIDDKLKGTTELDELVTSNDSASESITEKSDDTKTVSELFGEEDVNPEESEDSLLVDDALFAERPLLSLLVPMGTDYGVNEKNVYAVKKMLQKPEVESIIKTAGGQFMFGNDIEKPAGAEGQSGFYRLYYLKNTSELTGGVVEEAKANLGSLGGGSAGQPVVSLTMNSEGARTWARVTGANVGQRIAIVLDKKVHMAPNIREKIPSGRTQIEGFANINEAKDIGIILRAGALPAPVNIIEERIVGPSLGADSISQGTRSVIIGLALVLIFMVFYYKGSGGIADFALIWNILLVLAVLASLKATLTLPGIAGLILTVGMSIDANVIIFERIREELRKGKTPKTAIDAGYDRALTTIVDANVTTVIAALVLYQFGTGPIKGFATVLFWGILISMFTAVFVTRTIFNSLSARGRMNSLSI